MMRQLTIVMLLSMVCSIYGQRKLTGTVSDLSGEPLPGAVVRCYVDGKLKTFSTARTDGDYTLTVPAAAGDSIKVTAQCLGYEKAVSLVSKGTLRLDFVLHPSEQRLREITVEAPKIAVEGDTITYNLSAFLGKSDVTLEDGLKKVPGVDVKDNGEISYQGKSISKLYIEGLDMLGGRYNLATRNLPADYVTDIQVLNNHHEALIDRGKQSDAVAINVKLKSRIKVKPSGTSEALAGWGEDWLYRLGATGMIFSPSFQALVTGKIGNDHGFASEMLMSHVSFDGQAKELASQIIGSIGGSSPPVASRRYVSPVDRLGSINTINKLDSTTTVRVNASYSYSAARYAYGQRSQYYAGNNEVTFDEHNSAHNSEHKPSLDVLFNRNTPDYYLNNTLSTNATFKRSDFFTTDNDRDMRQHGKIDFANISDSFFWRRRIGRNIWRLNVMANYNMSPHADLTIADSNNPEATATQTVSSRSLNARINAGTDFVLDYWRISLPFTINYANDRVESELMTTGDSNDLNGHNAKLSVSPSFEYTSPNKRVELRGSLEAAFSAIHARNRADGKKIGYNRPHLNPNARLKYIFSPSFNITLSSGYTHSTGDILDLLTAPVMTSWRTQSARSGILARSKSFTSSMLFDYKKPFDFLFVNGSVSYTRSSRNQLNAQQVSSSDVVVSALGLDSHSRSTSASANVTKQFPSIGLKATIGGRYSWSANEMMQQEKIIPFYGQSVAANTRITLAPWRWTELQLSANWSRTFNRYLSVRESYIMTSGNGHLSIYPARGWDLFGEIEFVRKQLSDGNYKSMSLFDVGVSYKFSSFKLYLRAENLLNTRSYDYSIYNGLDTYSYSYRLRPRAYTVGITFTR